jgi:hypothetical protein
VFWWSFSRPWPLVSKKPWTRQTGSRLQDPTSASPIHGHEPQIVKVDVSTIVNQGFLCLVCYFDTLERRLCCLLHSREDSTAVILKVNREGSYFYVTNVFLVVVCCFHMLWEFVFSITFVAIHLKNFFYKQWVFHAYPLYFLGKDYRICRLIR